MSAVPLSPSCSPCPAPTALGGRSRRQRGPASRTRRSSSLCWGHRGHPFSGSRETLRSGEEHNWLGRAPHTSPLMETTRGPPAHRARSTARPPWPSGTAARALQPGQSRRAGGPTNQRRAWAGQPIAAALCCHRAPEGGNRRAGIR